MSGVFETMRVEAGHVRLLDRHLARLRRADVPEPTVGQVRALVARWCALEAADPLVLRIDVDACCATPHPRAARAAVDLDLVSVVAFDPADATRERKLQARPWAEAAEAAAGGEALCVSADGLVGETTRANVFALLADGTLVTPPARGLLPGVTRSWVLERTGAVERALPLAELRAARAAFVTTSGRGIVRIASVDGVVLGDDPLRATLRAAWEAL